MLNTILFDIDGVILSEERCFDASALAVWEFLNSSKYLGLNPKVFNPEPLESSIRSIRDEVFHHNHVLSFIKHHGVNSNWDIVFLTFSYQLLHLIRAIPEDLRTALLPYFRKEADRSVISALSDSLKPYAIIDYAKLVEDFDGHVHSKQDMFDHLNQLAQSIIGDDAKTWFSHKSTLWDICRETYQEWYVGDTFIEESIGKQAYQSGKKGFLKEEIPLAPMPEIINIFSTIKSMGYTVGFGTGRPDIETYEPLKEMGLLDIISRERITTSSDAIRAEARFPEYAPLGKPSPFSYLYTLFGKSTNLSELFEKNLPLVNGEEILIIGDSIADGLAARAMGAQFAAVLTGLTGEDARSEFEEFGSDYILNHVRDVLSLLPSLK